MKTLIAVAFGLSVASAAFATGTTQKPNCEINGKKEWMATEQECQGKHGKWMAEATHGGSTGGTNMPAGNEMNKGTTAPANAAPATK